MTTTLMKPPDSAHHNNLDHWESAGVLFSSIGSTQQLVQACTEQFLIIVVLFQW